MLHPITVQKLGTTHQRDRRALWRRAELNGVARQVKAAQPAQPGLVERVVHRVGTLLIDVSERLTERHAMLG
jgi:hypothetical protein